MKVGAYLAGHWPESGGGYTFETDILEALLERALGSRHTFALLCPASAAEALRHKTAHAGLEVLPVSYGGRVRQMLERESSFFRARWRRPSALDAAAAQAGVDFIWFLGAGVHRTDLPFLTVVWDLQHLATPWFPEMTAAGLWDMRELAHQWFLRRATAVIAGTRQGQEELLRFYQVQPERVLILPHPTPRFALEAAQRSPGALPRGVREPYILYPAQFWPHKNHINLVLALSILRQRLGLELCLVLVGSDKGNRAHVERAARTAGVAQAVVLPGFVSRDELVALYRHAAALTYVSFCGPENLPPLEAFALGCPVVASRIPGAQEQLSEAALLAAPDDPEALAHAIERVVRDVELRQRLVAQGKQRASRWTARDYVHGVLQFLDRFESVRRCWPSRWRG